PPPLMWPLAWPEPCSAAQPARNRAVTMLRRNVRIFIVIHASHRQFAADVCPEILLPLARPLPCCTPRLWTLKSRKPSNQENSPHAPATSSNRFSPAHFVCTKAGA